MKTRKVIKTAVGRTGSFFILVGLVCLYRVFTYSNTTYYESLCVICLYVSFALYFFQKTLDHGFKSNSAISVLPRSLLIQSGIGAATFFMLYMGVYKGFWMLVKPFFSSTVDFTVSEFFYRLFILGFTASYANYVNVLYTFSSEILNREFIDFPSD